MRRFAWKRGFTMIELLVVVVILGVLAAALMPAVGKFLKAGDEATSRNNLMRLGRAALTYRSDHGNCYPAAGGYFTSFVVRANGSVQERFGRARGWVYFEHNCPRSRGDIEAADDIGDGNHEWREGYVGGTGHAIGSGSDFQGTEVNEEGCCLCFDSTREQGGLGATPANWHARPKDMWSQAQVAIVNGCLYSYVGGDLDCFKNPTFEDRALEKFDIPRDEVVRAYAMNVITGTDEDLYDTDRYMGGGTEYLFCHPNGVPHQAIRLGMGSLQPCEDSDDTNKRTAMPAEVALFVELDLDNDAVASEGALEGDQVWDWDDGDESMGFNHEDNGAMFAHVCFADGHVEAIRDPSTDPDNPDDAKRRALSKWYGSGGVNASGEKLD